MEEKSICIVGGGSLGTVIAGVLSSKGIEVNLLTNHPEKWNSEIAVYHPSGDIFSGSIKTISSNAEDVIPRADVILLCLPGPQIKEALEKIAPYLTERHFLGSVFSSTGFFFEAIKIFGDRIPLWGFQRVPFIARVKEYGKSGYLLGYKPSLNIAIENAPQSEKEEFRRFIESAFKCPTALLGSYLEASLTNSNPLLHTARLYSLFAENESEQMYPRNFLFYEEWTDLASELLIQMDKELFKLIAKLNLTEGFLKPILEYYESRDAESLTKKIRSIESFKGIMSPMKEIKGGWVPDKESRYFQEDFKYGLRYIWQLCHNEGIECPGIDRVYEWGNEFL